MTASVQPESKLPSRRALLAGALGGLGALAASAIGRASPVRGGIDGDVVLGAVNSTSMLTEIRNTAGNAFLAVGNSSGYGLQGSSASGYGVYGTSSSSYGVVGESTGGGGVYGSSSSSTGMSGFSTYYIGVYASSGSHYGVQGDSSASDQPASLGRSLGNSTGVQGYSGGGSPPAAKAKTGVYGYAAQDNSSRGVVGESPAGHGIHGESSTGWAGYFDGRLLVKKYVELVEISNPSAPSSNHAKLFIRDNGSGKTQLCVRFHNGTIRVIAGA